MDELAAKLAALEIRSFEGDDGQYTVISSSEPYFCFVGSSHEELAELVKEALESYGRNFFGQSIEISTTFDMVEPVRTVKLEQRGRLRPSFNGGALERCFA